MKSKIYLDLDHNNQGELVIKYIESDDIRDKSVRNFISRIDGYGNCFLSVRNEQFRETKESQDYTLITIKNFNASDYLHYYKNDVGNCEERKENLVYSKQDFFEPIDGVPSFYNIISSVFNTVCYFKKIEKLHTFFFRDYLVITAKYNAYCDEDSKILIPMNELNFPKSRMDELIKKFEEILDDNREKIDKWMQEEKVLMSCGETNLISTKYFLQNILNKV